MAEHLQAMGCQAELEVWPRMFHVWHTLARILPGARAAIARVLASQVVMIQPEYVEDCLVSRVRLLKTSIADEMRERRGARASVASYGAEAEFKELAPTDGSAWTSGLCYSRVVRSGSWRQGPAYIRSASRDRRSTDIKGGEYGFRIGRTLFTP